MLILNYGGWGPEWILGQGESDWVKECLTCIDGQEENSKKGKVNKPPGVMSVKDPTGLRQPSKGSALPFATVHF